MDSKHTFKLCPSCDYFCNSKEADKYCSICGSELMTECPECKKSIANPYAKFCRYCGKAYPGRTKSENNN